jgi:1,2-dihydroxy-3-keto-5-methylthiopentene dioxygenase
MAVVSIPGHRLTLYDESAITRYLAGIGIDFERLPPADPLTPQVEALKTSKGYSVVDEINVTATTPGLADMLARFDREHWHDEDEVRFVLEGRGVFHIRLKHGDVVVIEVEPGDLIRVPAGTRHWFTLTPEQRIRAIRFFHNPSDWVPHYPGESITTGGFYWISRGPFARFTSRPVACFRTRIRESRRGWGSIPATRKCSA